MRAQSPLTQQHEPNCRRGHYATGLFGSHRGAATSKLRIKSNVKLCTVYNLNEALLAVASCLQSLHSQVELAASRKRAANLGAIPSGQLSRKRAHSSTLESSLESANSPFQVRSSQFAVRSSQLATAELSLPMAMRTANVCALLESTKHRADPLK